MEDIKTTGGVFTEESRRIVLSNICRVFDCEEFVKMNNVLLTAGCI